MPVDKLPLPPAEQRGMTRYLLLHFPSGVFMGDLEAVDIAAACRLTDAEQAWGVQPRYDVHPFEYRPGGDYYAVYEADAAFPRPNLAPNADDDAERAKLSAALGHSVRPCAVVTWGPPAGYTGRAPLK